MNKNGAHAHRVGSLRGRSSVWCRLTGGWRRTKKAYRGCHDAADGARRWGSCLFAWALLGASGLAQANVGRTPAVFHVNRDGAATYTIPIWAPPGPNGLEPHIALSYDSQSGSGYLGVGWALSGISSIYRCNRTDAQDGAPAPVTLTTNDAFCLDGARLQLTSGSYGAAGSTYQTELANFEQVTAYGTAGNGPAYFIVQAPDGTQYEYGNGGASQVLAAGTSTAMQWYLDKVTDPAGNTMTISYGTGTGSSAVSGSVVPSAISWTPGSYGSTTYDYTMQFSYETNAAASSIYGYVAGTNVENTNLLQSITVNYDGATVRKYALSYQQSPTTGRDELTQVEECADAGQTNCLGPTTFAYQDPPVGTTTAATTAISGLATQLVWNYDFNGDGRDDLAFCNASQQVEVAFASSSGYGTPVNTGIVCNGVAPLYGDLLGNGKDGILAPNGSTWYYYQWDGSSFVGQSTGLAYQTASQYALADVTGDGLPDLVELQTGSASLAIYVRQNTSSGSTVSFASSNPEWYSETFSSPWQVSLAMLQSTSDGQLGNVKHLDFNGDGRDDLALEYLLTYCRTVRGICYRSYQNNASELISTGSSFTNTSITGNSTSSIPVIGFLNFNSDACTDYLYGNVVYVSGCNGSPATTVTVPSSNVIGVMDWNGDGRGDILVNNSGTIGVYESTGTGLTSLISTSIPYNSSDVYFSFDPNGDGLDALGAWEELSSPYEVSYYSHNGTGRQPDLLTSITDGYGNTIKPTYVSLAQGLGSTYTQSSDASFPYENYTGHLYVVNQVTYSDPSNPPNGTYQRVHTYSGAWMNLQGRGFAGFATHSVYDSRNQLYALKTYDLAFPLTGMPLSDTVTENSASGQTVSSESNSIADTTISSTAGSQRYFPYVSASTDKQYAVGGTENGALTSDTSVSYSYDSYGNPTSISSTVTDEDSGSPDYGDSWTTTATDTPDVDTGTWCLRLLSESQVSYSASNGSTPVSQTRQYTPDTTNCRYDQIVTDPSSSTYSVTESLGYDSFGNINSESITGAGMSARTTTMNWGATGQFPTSITNALNEATSFNYDFGCGRVSSMTDPNGDTTSWQYDDGFCRVTQETRPDGTYTTLSYTLYSGSDPKPRMVIAEQPHDTQGNVISTTTEYLDMVDRPYMIDKTLLDGSVATVMQRTYDSLGRVVSTCAPFPVGSTSPGCTTYSYDALNRVVEKQRPISASDSSLATWSYQYNGLAEVITDPNGHTRTLAWDPTGWLGSSTDDLGYAVDFGYDAAGDEDQVTDNQGNTLWTGTYAYGIRPLLIGETSMDSGAWGFTVDALGDRIAWTDAKGQHFSETYDALSRPLTRSEPDLFTQWTWGSSATDHDIGKLASVCTGTGSDPVGCSTSGESESWAYDGYGRLSQRIIALPSLGTYAYTWQYNSTTGFLQSLTYPVGASGQGLTLQYGYANGYLDSITDTLDSPNIVVWKADAMNPAGQITEDTLGNGIITTRAFDAVTHLLTAVQAGEGGGTGVENMSFLYDPVGNLIERQNDNLGLTEDFYYDGDNRLSYSTLSGTQNLSLTYDAMGNITSNSLVLGGTAWTYDATHKHQVTQIGPYTPWRGPNTEYLYAYDSNGNMTSRNGSTIDWTSYNYPSYLEDTNSGESVTLAYGPNYKPWSESWQSSSGTTTTDFVGSLMDIVNDATDHDYIYAGNTPVAVDERTASSNDFYYFQTDQLGSITAITNGSGAVAVNEDFAAFGARRRSALWQGPPLSGDLTTIAGISLRGYTFHRSLGEGMGLVDMVGRVEDDIIGRFLSADPTMPNPYDPQDWNPYSYVENNPLTYKDPTGFDKQANDIGGGGNGGGIAPINVPPLPPIKVPGYYCLSCWFQTVGNQIQNIMDGILGWKIPPQKGTGLTKGKPGSNQPQKPNRSQSKTKTNPTNTPVSCGSSQGIPQGEALLPAIPSGGIFTSGSHSVVVTGNGSQVQVALTNDSFVPAVAVTNVSFQVGSLNLGNSGANIFSDTTSTFTSDMFGVLGPPLSMTVNIDIKNPGAVESAQFCVIGASGG